MSVDATHDCIQTVNPIYNRSRSNSAPFIQKNQVLPPPKDKDSLSSLSERSISKKKIKLPWKKKEKSSPPEKKVEFSIQEILLKSKQDTPSLATYVKSMGSVMALSLEKQLSQVLSPQKAWEYYDLAQDSEAFAHHFYESEIAKKQWDSSLTMLLKQEVSTSSQSTTLRGDNLRSHLWTVHFNPQVAAKLSVFLPEFVVEAQKFDEAMILAFCKKHLLNVYALEIPETLQQQLRNASTFLDITFSGISPVEKRSRISSLLFLRLICPQLINSNPLSKTTKIFCKVLQNISNEVLFGEKEQDYGHFNSLIQEFSPVHSAFLEKLISGLSGPHGGEQHSCL